MKYAHWTATAALLALGVYGAIPSSAEGWYTPSKGFTKQGGTGTVYYGYDKNSGTWQTTTVTVDENGNLEGGMDTFGRDYELRTAYEALVKACYNKAINDQQDEMIQTIGKNLDSVFRTDGIKMEMTKHGPGGDETTVTYTLKIKPGEGGNAGSITAEDPTPYGNIVDDRTIGWTQNDENGQLQLYGSTLGPMSTDQWWADDGFVVPFLKGGSTLGWKKFGGIDKVVFESRASTGDLTLKGFHSDGGCSERLSQLLTEASGTQRDLHQVVCRYGTGDNAVFHYLPIGDMIQGGGGSPVDDASITTNEADGATSRGVASLYGWGSAGEDDIPQKGDGKLKWTAPGDLVDDSSLAYATVGGSKVFEVKGAHAYAGSYASRYFGTDGSSSLGWHELPNVTTNVVSGDEATIRSNPTIPNVTPGEGVKVLGLAGWIYNYSGEPAFLVNRGGALDYIPFPSVTNLASCACTNKWRDTLEWIGDGEVNEDFGITFTSQSLDGYMHNGLSYVKRTDLDGVSLGTNDTGGVEIKGFYDASPETACSARLGDMLSNPESEDATTHLFLAKKTDSGGLHYVSIGDGVSAGAKVDGTSITTNASDGATSQGVASLYGWDVAATGSMPAKGAGGALEWVPAPSAKVDGKSIVTNVQDHVGEAAVAGFWDQGTQDGMLPVKSGDTLAWVSTNDLVSAKFNGSFSYFDGFIHDGCVIVGRTPIFVNGMEASSGDYRIRVTLGANPAAVLEQGNGFTAPSGTTSYIPVYTLSNGAVVGDYRGSFVVPSYE